MPTIVECLTDYKRAKQLAEILSAEKGEEYVVLEMDNRAKVLLFLLINAPSQLPFWYIVKSVHIKLLNN